MVLRCLGIKLRMVFIPILIAAYAENVLGTIGFLSSILHGWFNYSRSSIDNLESKITVEYALASIGQSFEGCELTQYRSKNWVFGKSYKVNYTCKRDGEIGKCRFHFRKTFGNFETHMLPHCRWHKERTTPECTQNQNTTQHPSTSPPYTTTEPSTTTTATETATTEWAATQSSYSSEEITPDPSLMEAENPDECDCHTYCTYLCDE